MILLTSGFLTRTGTSPPEPAFAPMKLSAYTAPLASIYKKKFTKICCTISRPIRINGDGFLHITDTNIDHRRVPNLMAFFARKGEQLPVSERSEDYSPGDLVTWDLGGNVPHIGIVVDRKSARTGRYSIVHNIGRGPQMEDVLFNWRITGHYRYFGPSR